MLTRHTSIRLAATNRTARRRSSTACLGNAAVGETNAGAAVMRQKGKRPGQEDARMQLSVRTYRRLWLLKFDVQFSIEMSMRCPIGHLNEISAHRASGSTGGRPLVSARGWTTPAEAASRAFRTHADLSCGRRHCPSDPPQRGAPMRHPNSADSPPPRSQQRAAHPIRPPAGRQTHRQPAGTPPAR